MAKTEPRDRDLSPPECQSTCPCQGMLPGSIQVNPPEQSNSPPQKEYWGALRPSIACCFEMSFSWFLFMDFLMGRPWVPQLGLSVCWPETRVCVQWPYGDSRHRHIIRMWGRSWARPQTPASPCQTPPSAKCSAHYTLWFPQWFLRVFFSIFKVQLPDEKPESLLLNLQKGLVSRSSTNHLNKKLEGFVNQNRQDRLSDYKSILDLPRAE